MAARSVNGEAAPANPESKWLQAVAALEMARVDAAKPILTDEEGQRYGKALSDAYGDLLLTPAPHLSAVADKLEVFLAEEAFGLDSESVHELVGGIIADLHRFGTEEAESPAFRAVADMEEPLRVTRDLLTGLSYIGQTLDEGGEVICTIAHTARDHLDAIEPLRGILWRDTHPDKARLDREGWPST